MVMIDRSADIDFLRQHLHAHVEKRLGVRLREVFDCLAPVYLELALDLFQNSIAELLARSLGSARIAGLEWHVISH